MNWNKCIRITIQFILVIILFIVTFIQFLKYEKENTNFSISYEERNLELPSITICPRYITYRYIDLSTNFKNFLLPWFWFVSQSCLVCPLAAWPAKGALRGKSWKETIFKILYQRKYYGAVLISIQRFLVPMHSNLSQIWPLHHELFYSWAQLLFCKVGIRGQKGPEKRLHSLWMPP